MAGVLRAIFMTAGKTGLTLSPMIIADDLLNDGKLLKAAAAKGWQGILHPIDTFERVSAAYTEKKEGIREIKEDIGHVRDVAKDTAGTVKGIVTGDQEALAHAGEVATRTAKTIKGKAAEALEAAASGFDSDGKGFGFGKAAGWLTALFGSGWLAKKLFFGGSSKDKDNDSGFGFGTLVKSLVAVLAVVTLFNHRDLIKGKFHEVTGNRFNSDSQSVAQNIGMDITGRSTGAFVIPTAEPTTATAKAFAAAQNTIDTAAGRPVRATVEGPTRATEELAPALDMMR